MKFPLKTCWTDTRIIREADGGFLGLISGSSTTAKEDAENTAEIVRRCNAFEELLGGCRLGLSRIESDVEGWKSDAPDGIRLREIIAKWGIPAEGSNP